VHNGKYHALDIVQHIVIPEAENLVALLFQEFCSFLVVFFLLQMLTSIQFNNEFLLDADKIRNVVADGMLSAEVDA